SRWATRRKSTSRWQPERIGCGLSATGSVPMSAWSSWLPASGCGSRTSPWWSASRVPRPDRSRDPRRRRVPRARAVGRRSVAAGRAVLSKLRVPPFTELHARLEWFTARVVTTSVQSVAATLARDDGTPVRTLYDGPVADSLSLKWDGLTAGGTLPAEGRYVLHVAPRPALQDGPRPLQVTLDITQVAPDTLPWPAPSGPALLPE